MVTRNILECKHAISDAHNIPIPYKLYFGDRLDRSFQVLKLMIFIALHRDFSDCFVSLLDERQILPDRLIELL